MVRFSKSCRLSDFPNFLNFACFQNFSDFQNFRFSETSSFSELFSFSSFRGIAEWIKQLRLWFYKLPAAGLAAEKNEIELETQNLGGKLRISKFDNSPEYSKW